MKLTQVRFLVQSIFGAGRKQKRLSIVLFFLFMGGGLNAGLAVDRYVSNSGVDLPSGGSINSPWQSVAYAASNTPSGSTIHVSAGIYAETSIIKLEPGVNLIGEDEANTIITTATPNSTETQNSVSHLLLMSSDLDGLGNVVVDGNQTISNITFDCNNHVVTQGVDLINRNIVTFDQITIKDCYLRALFVRSKANTFWSETITPADEKLIANITIQNSTFNNSGWTPIVNGAPLGWAYGAVQLKDIRDSVIRHSTFDESDYGGFNIKSSTAAGGKAGGNRIRIHNCQLIQRKVSGPGFRAKGFGIEFWNLANSEIYDNWTNGGFSIVQPGTINTSIHHNTFFMGPDEGTTEAIEISGAGNQIYANYIEGTGPGIAIWGADSQNLKVSNNVIYKSGNAIFISASPSTVGIIRDKNNISIDNNTIDSSLVKWNMAAVGLRIQDDLASSYINNINIRNNIISNTVDKNAISLTGKNGSSNAEVKNITNTLISHNLFFNNANINSLSGTDIDDRGATNTTEDSATNAITDITPYTGTGDYLGSKFQLSDGSQNPARGAGTNVDLTFLGASPDKGAFIQDVDVGARIEAEMNYSVADDVSTKVISVADRGMDSNKSVNIFDTGDTIRIHFYAPVAHVYSIQVRLRSGTINNSTAYFDGNGYGFKLDGITSVSLIGDTASISDFDSSGGGVYWGTMKGDVTLDAGRHNIEIRMNSSWGMVDYMELHEE